MRWVALLVGAGALSVGCGNAAEIPWTQSTPVPDWDINDYYSDLQHPSVVELVGAGGEGVGSGTVVAPDVVLTASSLASTAVSVHATDTTADIVGWDPLGDLAVVYLGSWSHGAPPWARMSRRTDVLEVGDSVSQVGFCDGRRATDRGVVMTVGENVFGQDATGCKSDLGGGTFKTYAGMVERLVGIHIGAYDIDLRPHRASINAAMTLACEEGLRTACQYYNRLPDPDALDRVYPIAAEGAGCAVTSNYFDWAPCEGWKEYVVNVDSWLGLYAYGDSCANCQLFHVNFEIQEFDGTSWNTLEAHNPPDAKGMVYTSSFRPSSRRIRVRANAGFYLNVFDLGIANGGFETGSIDPGWGIAGSSPSPTITSDPPLVATRGTFALGNLASATSLGADQQLWGYSTASMRYTVRTGSKLFFDTYAEGAIAHYHLRFYWRAGDWSTDSHVQDHESAGMDVTNGLSQHVFAFPEEWVGRTLERVEITFHAEETAGPHADSTIFLDNVSLR